MKRLVIVLLMVLSASPVLFAQKAAKQQILNTAEAMVAEGLYMNWTDSMLADKKMTLAHATARYILKQNELYTKEWVEEYKNRIIYQLMVQQFNGLIEDIADLKKAAQKHPEHLPACISAGTELLLQAYALGKNAVVVAMNSMAPLPWKVNYQDLLEGKVKTPIYKNDTTRTEKDNDGRNLLLPTERYKIMNDTYVQIFRMRIAIQMIIAKLDVDLTWQKAVLYAVKFDDEIQKAHSQVFSAFSSSINSRPLP